MRFWTTPPEQDRDWSELPDVLPDWFLEQWPLLEPPQYDCGRSCAGEPSSAPSGEVGEQAGWATPGVTGLAPATQPPF